MKSELAQPSWQAASLNAFGQVVILVSLWGLAGGGSFIFLRVFRAFRVMRLFKKLQSMRKILISLGACVKPVLSAFVILFILASVYAQVSELCQTGQGLQPPTEAGYGGFER
jgi:hypothetical protein